MKVLYVCPLAHLTGHPPFESAKETRIMKEHGVDVELLTFCGVHDGFPVDVKQNKVMSNNALLRKLRKNYLTQWVLKIFEYTLTILKAEIIADGRVIYLRDAEPFPHIVHIINLFFRKKWVVSSTGGIYTTGQSVSAIYRFVFNLSLVKLKFWYKLGRNKIKYSVQNEDMKTLLSEVYGDNVTVVPLGYRRKEKEKLSKTKARKQLGIPQKNLVLMVMGANHSGKDSETVFKALKDLENTTLIHVGATGQIMNTHPMELAKKYGVGDKCVIIDKQFPEEDKKLYFGATDWLVMSYKESFTATTSMLWESMSYDVPVIASSGNKLEEMVAEWNIGIVFRARIAESLRWLILNNQLSIKTLKENRNKFMDYYSDDRWFERTMELINGRR